METKAMEAQQAPSVVAIATKYGLIQGVLGFVVVLIPPLTGMKSNWVFAVISIAILVVLMVLAHGEFKRTHNRMMTYAQGLGSGTLFATVGAVVSSILVFIYAKFINTGYFAGMLKTVSDTIQQRGITGAQAQQGMALYRVIYSPVPYLIISVIAGVIIGFIVALIVSIFTQRGDPRVVR